jgi:hypothetical protein
MITITKVERQDVEKNVKMVVKLSVEYYLSNRIKAN